MGEVLVDGGAMLDLISQETAENLVLEKHIVRGLGMRLADDSLVRLDFYLWADIIVAGVVARIKAYMVPGLVTYRILLSRRWLKMVRRIEYHESNILYIQGVDVIKRKAQRKLATTEEIEVVRLPMEYGEATEWGNKEEEDAIEVLLHKLDHWDEGEEDGEVEAVNGSRLQVSWGRGDARKALESRWMRWDMDQEADGRSEASGWIEGRRPGVCGKK